MRPVLDRLRGGLIVSCQGAPDEPMHGSAVMAAFARAAAQGGARGIRANGPEDIRAIRQVVDLPILGLYKQQHPGCDVYITPTIAAAREVAEAGADVIAVDATDRPRPDGSGARDFIARVKAELGMPVLADVSTLDEGVAAAEAGADAVATTLSGYTPYSPKLSGPDFELLAALAARCPVPVILEGRVWEPAEVREAFARGAWAVVVGTAITRPQDITRRFAAVAPTAVVE